MALHLSRRQADVLLDAMIAGGGAGQRTDKEAGTADRADRVIEAALKAVGFALVAGFWALILFAAYGGDGTPAPDNERRRMTPDEVDARIADMDASQGWHDGEHEYGDDYDDGASEDYETYEEPEWDGP